MHLPDLIAALSQPAAFPIPVERVEVCQTHISAVFLGGDFVYKVKKPVKLGFLDFSTLELRKQFCGEEVRLNRRLAPDVYLAVVPITESGTQLQFEGAGSPVEWAVKMRRLPQGATLEARLEQGEIEVGQIVALAERVAWFHTAAAGNPHISSFGRFDVVARNIRENLQVAAPAVGRTISPPVRDRLDALTEATLARHSDLIEARAFRGVPRDTHGDLHLDHIYLFPDRPPPGDLVIVDCIEFNERFRYADPVADMAFAAMDLRYQGRWDLARSFSDAYFAAASDADGRLLLPLYSSYRAAVRGKVDGLQLDEPEISVDGREAALTRARGHWLLAMSQLEERAKRPCLVLVGGLPGTGKSTLARRLADEAGLEVIRSDVVRKELAGVPIASSAGSPVGAGLYAAEWTERTYAECLARAESMLFAGGRVLVDASFIDDNRRSRFLNAARQWGVPGLLFVCDTTPEIVRQRLAARMGDASDADWNVYRHAAEQWEAPGRDTTRHLHRLDTSGPIDDAPARALALMRQTELA